MQFSRLVPGHILLMEVVGIHKEVLDMVDNIGHTSVKDILVTLILSEV